MKKITILGTGYVGLVSGAGISDFGHSVTCADIIEEKIKSLRNGKIPIFEPGLEELVNKNLDAGRLSFTLNIDAAIQEAEAELVPINAKIASERQERVLPLWGRRLCLF